MVKKKKTNNSKKVYNEKKPGPPVCPCGPLICTLRIFTLKSIHCFVPMFLNNLLLLYGLIFPDLGRRVESPRENTKTGFA